MFVERLQNVAEFVSFFQPLPVGSPKIPEVRAPKPRTETLLGSQHVECKRIAARAPPLTAELYRSTWKET